MRRVVVLLLVWFVASCGENGNGGGSPTRSSEIVMSVSVLYPAGGPIFIGNTVQFQAQEILSDGTTRLSASATWGSDNPAVATVSPTGQVTAIAAGEATIFAGVNPRGIRLIRVLPNFAGTWAGNELVVACEATGVFSAIDGCDDPDLFPVGTVFRHDSTLTQMEAAVTAAVDAGDGHIATASGTISVGGELALSPAPFLPADPDFDVQLENWKSRSDVPSRMTGGYDFVLTIPGVPGSLRVGLALENVLRSASPAALGSVASGGVTRGSAVDRMRRAIQAQP